MSFARFIHTLRILIIVLTIFNIVFLALHFQAIVSTAKKILSSIKQTHMPLICRSCNILIIDFDILRADELPCYGYFRNTTPNICRFAEQSVVFRDNYSTAHWTLPSAFSTITSLYPAFHRVRNLYVDTLPTNVPTMAEFFQKKGYQTVLIGDNKFFLDKANGGVRGYDIVTHESVEQTISRFSQSSKPWFIHIYRRDLHLPYLLGEEEIPIENLPAPEYFPTTYSNFDQKLNIQLKTHYKKVFNTLAIHTFKSVILAPTTPNDISVSQLFYKIQDDGRELEYLHDSWKHISDIYTKSIDPNNPSHISYVRMLYDTRLRFLDDQFGKLFQQLDTEQLSENTIAVFMSDHGESFGEHGVFGHEPGHSPELFYTPLIIRTPKLIKRTVNISSSNMDIFPTLIALTGNAQIDTLQGKSLVPYIQGMNLIMQPFITSEDGLGGVILQNNTWLYFLSKEAEGPGQAVLYNKQIDPLEKNNVISENLDMTQSLYKQAILLRSYNEISIPETGRTTAPSEIKIDPEKIKRMQKEGYF